MARQLCTPHLELGAQFKFGSVVVAAVVDVANVQTNSITQIKYSSNHQQQQQQEQEKHKS